MTRREAWVQFMAAALTGAMASESEEFNYGHISNITSRAANVADLATNEYDKRAAKDEI